MEKNMIVLPKSVKQISASRDYLIVKQPSDEVHLRQYSHQIYSLKSHKQISLPFLGDNVKRVCDGPIINEVGFLFRILVPWYNKSDPRHYNELHALFMPSTGKFLSHPAVDSICEDFIYPNNDIFGLITIKNNIIIGSLCNAKEIIYEYFFDFNGNLLAYIEHKDSFQFYLYDKEQNKIFPQDFPLNIYKGDFKFVEDEEAHQITGLHLQSDNLENSFYYPLF